MMIYKTDMNSSFVTNQVGRVLSCLKNWELLGNRDIKFACKTLNLISHSINGSILVEQSNIITLAKLLKSTDVKTEIKFAVVSSSSFKNCLLIFFFRLRLLIFYRKISISRKDLSVTTFSIILSLFVWHHVIKKKFKIMIKAS